MNEPLRILHLEDNPLDTELITEILEHDKISCQILRVETRAEFVKALAENEFDLLLSDYSLPTFDGLAAMAFARENYPDLPFLIVTGTLGEETVIEALKSGATDYILKQHMARLASSISRALREAKERRERKRAETALRDNLALYTTLIENLQMGVLVEDEARRILNHNQTFCQWFALPDSTPLIGRDSAELLEQTQDLFSAPQEFFQALEAHRQTGKTVMAEEIYLADGRILERDYVPIHIGNQRFAHLWMYRDMTERKHLEEQFRQSQKMEAIGQLAGGIAHDFNNLLTVIIGFSGLLLYRFEANQKGRQELEEIEKAARRAATLISQLLAFSRKQVLQAETLDLNAIITDMNQMLARIIGEDIELLTVLEPALGKVKADPGQMEQIIMNLAVNARDAMPKGGKLTLTTANLHLDEGYALSHAEVKAGEFVLLTVSDTGSGMDKATQSRIFEPFFTTKELGKGTGLGLSTVYGIIKQSNGHIWVYSEPEHGTTFKIYLPCCEESATASNLREASESLRQGTETILLVEDEEALRQMVSRSLTMLGYTVLEASNGSAALALCAAYAEEIHLLITDVIMPHLNGVELAEQIAALRPAIKVLFMTGYTGDTILHRQMTNYYMALLQKPFSPDVLARKVGEVLDAPTAP
ncbi:MAG: response regulator [Acidobacteria bacterium]|nr:response regulator [Acidobacteriota bacterium]